MRWWTRLLRKLTSIWLNIRYRIRPWKCNCYACQWSDPWAEAIRSLSADDQFERLNSGWYRYTRQGIVTYGTTNPNATPPEEDPPPSSAGLDELSQLRVQDYNAYWSARRGASELDSVGSGGDEGTSSWRDNGYDLSSSGSDRPALTDSVVSSWRSMVLSAQASSNSQPRSGAVQGDSESHSGA